MGRRNVILWYLGLTLEGRVTRVECTFRENSSRESTSRRDAITPTESFRALAVLFSVKDVISLLPGIGPCAI